MRPTIDEQLAGARRLLSIAENEQDPDGVGELIRNARRLVDRVATSWATSEPFLRSDNFELAELLGVPDLTPEGCGLAPVVAINEILRGRLSERIRELGPGPDRDAVGDYLRRRLTADPT